MDILHRPVLSHQVAERIRYSYHIIGRTELAAPPDRSRIRIQREQTVRNWSDPGIGFVGPCLVGSRAHEDETAAAIERDAAQHIQADSASRPDRRVKSPLWSAGASVVGRD